MSEKEFLKVLIEMIRKGNHPQKHRILELLNRSKLVCDKTSEFSRHKWNHYREYIHIITDVACFEEMRGYKEYLSKLIEEIYPVGDDYDYEFFGLDVKPGSITPDEFISQEIHFDDIQQQILSELDTAKYTIWVAMAWFTNKSIFDMLVKKKKEGVNIQLIIDNNDKNKTAKFILENEFETYRMDISSLYKNIMHDKFCVIDFQVAIHGTFNWTEAANYNKETISIDRNSTTARTFADEFMRLKRACIAKTLSIFS